MLYSHATRNTNYFSFLSSLIGKKNDLRDLKAYGSDGEVPLLNALVAAFPDAIGLRYFIHMKDNIKDHLHNTLHVKSEVKSAIIHDIFGHVVGDTMVHYFKWQCISYTTVCIVVHYLREYYMYTMDYVNNHKLAKVSYAVVYGKQPGMTLMIPWVITAVKKVHV